MKTRLLSTVLASCLLAPASNLLADDAAARAAPVSVPPTPAPAVDTEPEGKVAAAASIPEAISKGVAYIVKSQNPDGSWGTGRVTRGYEVYSSIPGSHDAFRVATTALCVMALREVGEKEAHKKGLEYLIEHGEARRDTGDLIYNTWAHTYALQALAMEMRDNSQDPRLKKAAMEQIQRLDKFETFMGGWNYYDFEAQTQKVSMGPTSFGTSAGLVALLEAKHSGVEIPQKMADRAKKRLEEMRLPNGAYLYNHDHLYNPRHPANRERGSVGRTQAGNYALWVWDSDHVDRDKIISGLDMFFAEHDYIEMGRKRQFPHESWYKTAPYYYYFGHYYTGLLLEKLGPEATKKYGPQLAAVILPHQEPDGSWWDYAMWDYHKPYGTAFAIMTLRRCQ